MNITQYTVELDIHDKTPVASTMGCGDVIVLVL